MHNTNTETTIAYIPSSSNGGMPTSTPPEETGETLLMFLLFFGLFAILGSIVSFVMMQLHQESD
ncbi:MAG: hypothetical protein ACPGVO_17040 [Spirulinaceae cyanobacterium]